MRNYTAYICVAVLSALLTGCGATAKLIAAKSQSERGDVFTDVTNGDAKPQGYVDLIVKADIKTHEADYYIGESGRSLHGKPGYPFVLNIDGQAMTWKVDGQKDVKPAYNEDGTTSRDPEARLGIKYILEKKLRLREGAHKVYFVLPEESYIVDAEIKLRSGDDMVLEFKPLYWHKNKPTRIPTFLKGVSKYEIFLNSEKIN
jgi:hypothetical protein